MAAMSVFLITAAIAAISSAAYGVYAGERAAKTANDQYNQARKDAQDQNAQQQKMLADQQAKADALQAQQAQAQKDAIAQQQRVQQTALTNAQAAIPTNQANLGNQLLASEKQAYSQMEPQQEARLNALGLLQSGALPQAQAQIQGNLESQRQNALANYGIQANQAVQNQAMGYAGSDANFLQNNLNQTLNNETYNQVRQFEAEQQAYKNQVAQSGMLNGMKSDMNANVANLANQYVNLGGQIGGAAMNLYGQQQKQTPNPSVASRYSTQSVAPTGQANLALYDTPGNNTSAAYNAKVQALYGGRQPTGPLGFTYGG